MSATTILAIVSIVLFVLLIGAAIVIYVQTIQKAKLRQDNNELRSGLGFITMLCTNGNDGSQLIEMIQSVADRSVEGSWNTSVAPVVLGRESWEKL